jgi:VanZ family protein
MSLPFQSLIALIALFLIAQVTTFIFGVRNEKFYAPFHFGAGILLGIMFLSILKNSLAAIVLSITVGFLWEIYEQIIWKYVLKKERFKPRRQDTINDLFLDLLGSLVGIFTLLRPLSF